MDVPGGQHLAGAAVAYGQVQHGPDALAGALGGVAGPPGAEQGGGVCLALGQDAAGLVEGVRPGDLRDVPAFKAQKRASLVAGHVEPHAPLFPVGFYKVVDRGVHRAVSLAAFIMMAHSMRLRNSSQPASYTPRMEPVAW